MSDTNLAKLNCAEIVIKTMVANGMDTLYCLPGVQNDDFFDALARIGGLQAGAYAPRASDGLHGARRGAGRRASRRPIAWCPGPGFLNATTPLATAQSL